MAGSGKESHASLWDKLRDEAISLFATVEKRDCFVALFLSMNLTGTVIFNMSS
jgi:hypothetical protein